MVKARKYVIKKYFEGVSKKSDFDIVEYELPPLKNGDILVKTEWIVADPYLLVYNGNMPVPYDQFGYQVGIVEDSKSPVYPVGTRAVTRNGWCDYSIANIKNLTTQDPEGRLSQILYKLPELKDFPPSIGIGAFGIRGITAYYAFLEGCQPKAGETVVIAGGPGTVGTVAGKIAKVKGCKVICFTGSDDVVNWCEKKLGFDKAFNYKTVDVQAVLKTAAPKGVDCFVDNFGGDISSVIISQMNRYGRVCVVGCIMPYNLDPYKTPTAPILQPSILSKELKIQGFVVDSYGNRAREAIEQLITYIKDGKLKPKEHVTVGFDKLYDAFVGMLAEENKGKAVVTI